MIPFFGEMKLVEQRVIERHVFFFPTDWIFACSIWSSTSTCAIIIESRRDFMSIQWNTQKRVRRLSYEERKSIFSSFRNLRVEFHAEDCNFVVEGIPSIPYGSQLDFYSQVETNMKQRSLRVRLDLEKHWFVLDVKKYKNCSIKMNIF